VTRIGRSHRGGGRAPSHTKAEARWDKGDVFQIPLADATYAYGQVLHRVDAYGSICALFARHDEHPSEDVLGIATSKVWAVACIGSEPLATGRWAVIGQHAVAVSYSVLPKAQREWSRHHRILPELAQGLLGLMDWETRLSECLRPDAHPPQPPTKHDPPPADDSVSTTVVAPAQA